MTRTKHFLPVLVLAGLQVGCVCVAFLGPFFNKCPVSYADDRYLYSGRDITKYVVPDSLKKSPAGIPIGPGVDGATVDLAFKTVADCLGVRFHPCGVHAVLIAPDWFVAPGTERQVFPCTFPDPNIKLCTGVNQYPATIFITPDMSAIYWEAERMLLRDDPNKDGGKNCWQRRAL